MSYGRRPYYIISTGISDDDYSGFQFFNVPGANADDHIDGSPWIPYDAMAQFVASMWRRDHTKADLANLRGELLNLIKRGIEVRPEIVETEWKLPWEPVE